MHVTTLFWLLIFINLNMIKAHQTQQFKKNVIASDKLYKHCFLLSLIVHTYDELRVIVYLERPLRTVFGN